MFNPKLINAKKNINRIYKLNIKINSLILVKMK